MIEEGFSFVSDFVTSNRLPVDWGHTDARALFDVGLSKNDLSDFIPSPLTLAETFDSSSVPNPPSRGESTIDVYSDGDAHRGYLDELHDNYIKTLKSAVDEKLGQLDGVTGPEADRVREELFVLRAQLDRIEAEIRAILLEKVEISKPTLIDKTGEYAERLKDALDDFKVRLSLPDDRHHHAMPQTMTHIINPEPPTKEKFPDTGEPREKTDNFGGKFPGIQWLEELMKPFTKRGS